MKRLKKSLVLLCFFIFFTGMSVPVFSQPGDPGGDPDVPITGIEWLLIGGGAFGAKKVYDKFKRKA